MNPGGQKELTREELYEKVWSTPTVQVAAELGISDVALAKRCKKLNVPKPPLGYWAKVAAGQTLPKPPLPAGVGPTAAEPLDGPVPKELSLPDGKTDLHLLAIELRVALRDAEPEIVNQCVKIEDKMFPRVTVSKAQIDRATGALHVILTQLERRGIQFRKSSSKYEAAYFLKDNDRLYLVIEERTIPRELTPQEKRRPQWSWQQPVAPTGKLIFSINSDRHRHVRSPEKKWVESEKLSLEQILSQITQSVCQHYIDLEKERIAAAERWRKEQEESRVRQEEENKRQHATNLEFVAQTRSEDLIKAAEWWRLHENAMAFIAACEQRWRGDSVGELTAEQQAWLAWARESANAMSPFETGYPDPAKDGAFDPTSVSFGGPYPAMRKFPHPPTMPKIPAPVVQQNAYSNHPAAPKEQFPFWLLHRGR